MKRRKKALGAIKVVGRRCPREGLRVVFRPNPVSAMMYSQGATPRRGTHGSVTTVPIPGGRKTCMPGPGGGLVYVKWDDYGTAGVSPIDLDKEQYDTRPFGPRAEKYLRSKGIGGKRRGRRSRRS